MGFHECDQEDEARSFLNGRRFTDYRPTVERSILLIREHKVMLDSDLASLYEVETEGAWSAQSSGI